MKKERKWEKNNNLKIFLIIISVVVFLLLVKTVIINDSGRILDNKTRKPNTIELYVYKEPHNPNNLDKKHFADVYVINGSLDAFIFDREEDVYNRILRAAFDDIEKKETLPLTVEPELGLIQSIEVPKNDCNYIYAVAEYLEGNFFTNVGYTERSQVRKGLPEFKCMDIYDEINSDLQNANYCNIDSDCETLPLAGPYIEFGCYHYINKNENSTDFYNRMNEYLADCERVIDLCAESPTPKCENGICVEK